ncbi:MAG: hypothetical protein NC218_02880 [Acetobacter sp.]|nr:hypothetical protein [Acetobacter sp.]
MKKIGKLLRFMTISIFVLAAQLCVGQIVFKVLWNFDLLNRESYQMLYNYWEKGGVFNTFRDCSLGAVLLLFPIIWLIISHKIYKRGFWKSIISIIDKSYRKITRPQSLEIEHVSIKNIGGKDKTLEEIITDKIKEQNNNTGGHTSVNIRKQIAAKIEENEKE